VMCQMCLGKKAMLLLVDVPNADCFLLNDKKSV